MADVTRRSYDLVAADYAAELGDELRRKPLDRALLDAFAELTAGGPVADLGCGPGQAAAHLSHRTQGTGQAAAHLGGRVLGVDLSPAMCAAARRAAAVPVCAGDLTALPIRSGALSGLVSLYAVIHLDDAARAVAYAEFARVLAPGGHVLVSFHTADADTPTGGAKALHDWWGHDVDLVFRFLDPDAETRALGAAGLEVVARLDRAPIPGVEHPSARCSLLARRASEYPL